MSKVTFCHLDSFENSSKAMRRIINM